MSPAATTATGLGSGATLIWLFNDILVPSLQVGHLVIAPMPAAVAVAVAPALILLLDHWLGGGA